MADYSAGLFELAEESGVSMADACSVARIHRSTPLRWRSGKVRPAPWKIRDLRKAIIALAKIRAAGRDDRAAKIR